MASQIELLQAGSGSPGWFLKTPENVRGALSGHWVRRALEAGASSMPGLGSQEGASPRYLTGQGNAAMAAGGTVTRDASTAFSLPLSEPSTTVVSACKENDRPILLKRV